MAKIINSTFVKDEEVGIENQKVVYLQNTDTYDSNIDSYQYLKLEAVAGDGFDKEDNTQCFIRMSVSNEEEYGSDNTPFWSINGPEDLVEVFNDFARRTGMSCRWEINKYYVKIKEERIDEKNENR